jgi:hypothetical protein
VRVNTLAAALRDHVGLPLAAARAVFAVEVVCPQCERASTFPARCKVGECPHCGQVFLAIPRRLFRAASRMRRVIAKRLNRGG